MDGISASVLDQTPAMWPPPGQTSNFVDPPDLLVESIVVAAVSLGLAVLLYGVRLFVKCFLVRKLYPEDYTCGISICVFAALAADICIAVLQGSSRHQWNVNLEKAVGISYTAYWGEIVFCVAICLAKISVLQQIRRIFAAGQKGALYTSCTLLIWLNAGFYTAASLAGIFSCTPRQGAWDPFTTATCINKMMLIVISSGINVLSDLCILFIPLWCVWHLNLPMQKKLALGAVFLMGIFSLGMAILKLFITIPLLTTQDLTYTLNLTGLSACAETSSATLVGCLPSLPRFIKFLRNRRSQPSTDDSYTDTDWSYHSKKRASPRSGSGNSFDSMAYIKAKFGITTMSSVLGTTQVSTNHASAGEPKDIPPLDMTWPSVSSTAYAGEDAISPTHVPSPPVPARIPVSSSLPALRSLRQPTYSPPPVEGSAASHRYKANKAVGPIPVPIPQSAAVVDTPSDSSCKSPEPQTKQQPRPRRRSLSDLASSPASQRTMQALAGKYWLDLEIGDADEHPRPARNHDMYMMRRDEARNKYRRQGQ